MDASVNLYKQISSHEERLSMAEKASMGLTFLGNELPKSDSDIDPNKTVMIPIKELKDFKNHPFLVLEDKKLKALELSIRDRGILHPLVVRKAEGGYEIISGHRRKEAACNAGLKELPCLVVNCEDDDDAMLYVCDTNLQRDTLLPSEKAKLVYNKYNILTKRRGERRAGDGRSRDMLSKEFALSPTNIARCLKLYALGDDFMKMVDAKKLKERLATMFVYQMSDETKNMVFNGILDGRNFDEKCLELIISADKQGTLTQEGFDNIVVRYFADKEAEKERHPVEHVASRPVAFADYSGLMPRHCSDQTVDYIFRQLLKKYPGDVAALINEREPLR